MDMKRVVIGLILVGMLLALTACAGQADTVDSLTQQALDWLMGEGAPAAAASPTATLLATPTLAPTLRATRLQPTATREQPPTATATRQAAPAPTMAPAAGAFEGDFTGVAYGDGDTTATIALALTHRNDEVAGTVTIGNGLRVSAGGFCGAVPVPATVFVVQTPLSAQSRQLETTQFLNVDGFDIEVALVATLSADGQSMTAKATLFTPALCSRDPVIQAELSRQ
jgi:hypothetical protein